MIKFLLFFIFSIILFASDELNAKFQTEDKSEQVYTVQIFSDESIERAKKILNRVPTELRNDTYLYKVDGYYKGRYSQNSAFSKIKPDLKKFHKIGFKGAFIVETTISRMAQELVENEDKNTTAVKEEVPSVKEVISAKELTSLPSEENLTYNNKETPQKNNLNSDIPEFDKSDMLLKAQNAYKKGNEGEAMIYYEKFLSSDFTNEKVKNNLCYLYGKQGGWEQAKKIIEKENYQKKFIYAYAYGAVQTDQENYYNDMSEYVEVDNSGRLSVLTGYYFEKRDEMQKADVFYKKAYEKNKTDVYNIFVYARAMDIKQSKEALTLYKDALSKIDNQHVLYKVIQNRIIESGE